MKPTPTPPSKIPAPPAIKALKPLHDFVLVRLLNEHEDETPGGILLPARMKEKGRQRGQVVAVGPGLPIVGGRAGFRVPEVKKGDIVLLGAQMAGMGTEVVVAGEKLYLFHERDILARIED